MALTGVHILLTYDCTQECNHCFLHCGTGRGGTFTVAQLELLLKQITAVRTVTRVYFEGGEPFLYHPLLVEGVRLARARALEVGIVTNAYWATTVDDAQVWLRPLADLGVVELAVSADRLHGNTGEASAAQSALEAARRLNIHCEAITVGEPCPADDVMFRGRAADMLVEGLARRPAAELTRCPHEDLPSPERVHVDAFGHVHLCQGLTIGNVWTTPLAELLRRYNPRRHPIAGPLIEGGPARLAAGLAGALAHGFVDECHLCYLARRRLRERYPEVLAPAQVYGEF